MVGKLRVARPCRPSERALARNVCGVGLSLETTASPPSNWRASRTSPPLSRSAKKPTAVNAATASVTATISKRSSPARRSRHRVRHPSSQKEVLMGTPYPIRLHPAPPGAPAAAAPLPSDRGGCIPRSQFRLQLQPLGRAVAEEMPAGGTADRAQAEALRDLVALRRDPAARHHHGTAHLG